MCVQRFQTTRRIRLRLVSRFACLFVLAGLAVSCSPEAEPEESTRPNILVVVTDDQRASGTLPVMPNVRDRFLEEGTRFSNAFTTTPLCCPARASIFTGLYAHNHGVRHNYESAELQQGSTMQRHLQDAGYRTAIAGKFLNDWDPNIDPPYFDRWAIFLQGEYYDRQFNLQGEVTRLSEYSTDVVRKRALGFLTEFEQRDDQPWFLYVATGAAHAPFTPEPSYRRLDPPAGRRTPALAEEDLSDKPAFIARRTRRHHLRRKQLRTLVSADDLVGELFDLLSRQGELEETLAIFTSDNGMQWGEHGFTGKRHAYPESIQVPLFLRWPGHLELGATDERLAANIDIAPTILQAAGIDSPPEMDGRSLLDETSRTRLLLEHWGDQETSVPDWRGLRTDSFHFVEYLAPDGAMRFREYYDLARDPWLLENLLADEDPANDPGVARLHRLLRRIGECMGSECP